MKELKNAVIVNGVAYQINATEAQKIAKLLGLGAVEQPKIETPKDTTPKSEPKTASKKSTRIVGFLSAMASSSVQSRVHFCQARLGLPSRCLRPKTLVQLSLARATRHMTHLQRMTSMCRFTSSSLPKMLQSSWIISRAVWLNNSTRRV